MGATSSYDKPVLKFKILKKDGVEIMGEHMLPNPPFPGGHNTAFTPAQELTDQVIQATKEAQRDAFTIEDDAITQLEASDRFEYTVEQILELARGFQENIDCCENLLGLEDLPMTGDLIELVVYLRDNCLMELTRLQAGRVVV